MKYYLGTIDELNCGMEYSDKFLFSTKGSAAKHMDKVAREWRGCTKKDWDKNQNGYWSDCTLVSEGGYKEIPKEDFDILSKYIAVL